MRDGRREGAWGRWPHSHLSFHHCQLPSWKRETLDVWVELSILVLTWTRLLNNYRSCDLNGPMHDACLRRHAGMEGRNPGARLKDRVEIELLYDCTLLSVPGSQTDLLFAYPSLSLESDYSSLFSTVPGVWSGCSVNVRALNVKSWVTLSYSYRTFGDVFLALSSPSQRHFGCGRSCYETRQVWWPK